MKMANERWISPAAIAPYLCGTIKWQWILNQKLMPDCDTNYSIYHFRGGAGDVERWISRAD
jgi:hypothetical protein